MGEQSKYDHRGIERCYFYNIKILLKVEIGLEGGKKGGELVSKGKQIGHKNEPRVRKESLGIV